MDTRAEKRKFWLRTATEVTFLNLAVILLLCVVAILCYVPFKTGHDVAAFTLIAAYLVLCITSWVMFIKRTKRRSSEIGR